MTRYRTNRPEPAEPPPTTEVALVAPGVPVQDRMEEIHIGSSVRIPLDLGPRGDRYDSPRPMTRLKVNGYGMVDEERALELARELLTGVAELRRRHATADRPYDPSDVTLGGHDVRLSVRPVDYARTTTAVPGE